MSDRKYYHKVVRATEEFLGPAAERFVNRQLESRLGKTPDTMERSDIPKLGEALSTALGVLVKDKQMALQARHKFELITKE